MLNRPWIRRTAVALAAIAGIGMVAVLGYDQAAASRLLPGMRIDGVPVGGMTRAEAIDALALPAAHAGSATITVRAGDARWTTTRRDLGAVVDPETTVDRAFSTVRDLGLLDRVLRHLRGAPLDVDLPIQASVDPDALTAWVDDAASSVDAEPADAVFALVDGEVVRQPAVVGRALDRAAAVRSLRDAIASNADAVDLPVTESEPGDDGAALGKTIVVDISENTLLLYDGMEVEVEYRVATGAPGYPTPLGAFQIIRKAENPTWVNPDPEGWGKDYPPSIPPGPGNPLGTRALYLDAPGIRIHGTYNASSIGTFASHGCVRMLIADSEALYPLVPVGTRVFIVA